MADVLMNLEQFIIMIDNWGAREVLLPFLLIFTVIFAVLQKARIFGDDKKNMNLAVATIEFPSPWPAKET